MNTESNVERERRARAHAALGDVARLRIVDTLSLGDASPKELATALDMTSNLLAFHLKVLEDAGLVVRQRSEGDRRRTYLRLCCPVPQALGIHSVPEALSPSEASKGWPDRVVFVCTANSARSHLAAALWRSASDVPVTSAGTHPAERIDPRAIRAGDRHALVIPEVSPRYLEDALAESEGEDLIVTVCDLAHEELERLTADRSFARLHWSVPDPNPVGTKSAYDAAHDTLASRVADLAARLPHAS